MQRDILKKSFTIEYVQREVKGDDACYDRDTISGQFFRVSGYRLQLRLQAVVQVPEKKRGASQIRKQQHVHMAWRAGERHVLRSRPHQMRYQSLPATVAELSWSLSQKCHLLLSGGAKPRAGGSSGSTRR